MTPVLSAFLDTSRLLAAFAVLLSHMSSQRLSAGFLWQLEPLGAQAVIIFFVISGFVIGHVASGREADPGTFALHRLSRLYSVVLPALLLTALLDTIGRHLHPALYSAAWGFDPSFHAYLRAATFTNALWAPYSAHLPGPGSNLPFWSLGYEATYYALFATVAFNRSLWGWAIAALLSVIAGPWVAALLPVWLTGLASRRVCAARLIAPPGGAAVIAFALCVLVPALRLSYAGGRTWLFTLFFSAAASAF